MLLTKSSSLKEFILFWLEENNPQKLQPLWELANYVRKKTVGDEVHLRGLLEISNYCQRRCSYCGINVYNAAIPRYRMQAEEILSCAKKAEKFGYGTIVMQSGEDIGLTADWIANVISMIKNETSLAITLSFGERSKSEFAMWKKAGADRYLLRFETTDLNLYRTIHPSYNDEKISISEHPRIAILEYLRTLGYEVGSGIMIGFPGQTYKIIADDIIAFQNLDLDMIGTGPYIQHPETQMAKKPINIDSDIQVPNTELMTYKLVALTRIVCPEANIPATTALATLNKASGRESALMRGANVVMPNITPPEYRKKYEIYPGKACIDETAEQCQKCMQNRIESLGRSIAKGPGKRNKKEAKEDFWQALLPN